MRLTFMIFTVGRILIKWRENGSFQRTYCHRNHERNKLPLLNIECKTTVYGNERDHVEISVKDRDDRMFYIKRNWKNLKM